MAQKVYVGVGNTASNVKNIYIGVGGVARKVVKGYVGVGGVAHQFWGGSTPSYATSWDFWFTTNAGEIVGDGVVLHKTNNKIAYYAVVKNGNSYTPILVSPNADAVAFSIYDESTGTSTPYTYNGSVTINNTVWYYNVQGSLEFDNDPDFLLGNSSTAQADATALINAIYAEPFYETYSTGNTYSVHLADNEKVIRKFIGAYLWRTALRTETAYITFSDNADAIITDALNAIGSGDVMLNLYIQSSWDGSRSYINCLTGYTSNIASQFTANSHYTSVGYDYFNCSLDASYTFSRRQAFASPTGLSYGSVSSETTSDITIGVNSGGARSSNIGMVL